MGLKDEVVVANDPNEKSEGNVDDETEAVSEPDSENSTADDGETESTGEEEEEEEDLVDPQDTLKEACALKKECVKLQEELDRCTERVNSKTNTSETCAQELYDFVHCVDHCVGEKIFSKLK